MTVSLGTNGGMEFALGYAGQVADLANSTILSRINEQSSEIPYGRAVAKGASGGCRLMTGSYYQIVGLSVKNPIHPRTTSGTTAFAQYDSVPLLVQGDMYVLAAENARDGDAVIAIAASGGTLGSSQGGVADETARITVPGAYWIGAATAGQIGKIRVNVGQTIRTTT